MGRGRVGRALVPAVMTAGTSALPTRPLPITHSRSWSPEAPPLVGVQGAKPPGGVRGEAPALLPVPRHLRDRAGVSIVVSKLRRS